jgi:hypothetical protein
MRCPKCQTLFTKDKHWFTSEAGAVVNEALQESDRPANCSCGD